MSQTGDKFKVIDQNDFSGGVSGSGWTDSNGNDVTSEGSVHGDAIMGDFAGTRTHTEQISKTYNFDENAGEAKIEFNFVKINSWDTEWSNQQESFGVYLGGQQIIDYKPDGALQTGRTIGGGDGDLIDQPFSVHIDGATYSGTYSVTSSGQDSHAGVWGERDYKVEITLDDPPAELRLGVGAKLYQSKSDESWGIDDVMVGQVCFTAGTHIETQDGARLIENLKVGDLLRTFKGELRALRWIGHNTQFQEHLEKDPKLAPVCIVQGALGNGLPKRDLRVSQNHRILVNSKIAEQMFGEKEVLVAASMLTALPGIYVETDCKQVTYLHLLFDSHEIIFAQGAAAESFYLGPNALNALSKKALEEVLILFPDAAYEEFQPKPACLIPPRKQQRLLVSRHADDTQNSLIQLSAN